jgi:hypothetical protein
MKQIVVIIIAVWVFTYLCVAFVAGTFNSMQWTLEGRGGYIFLSFFITMILLLKYESIKD